MIQWTSKARQMIQQESEEYGKELKQYALLTLNQLNAKRQQYGLKPKHRIDKDVIKQTILNITVDTLTGDASRKENNFLKEGGMYQ